MTAFFGGCSALTAAAIAGGFETRLWPGLLAAAPWLALAALMWAGVVWPDLGGRPWRGLRALAAGALWVGAVSLAAAGVVAFLTGVALAFACSRPLLRARSEPGPAATMDAQT
jgi:cytochrome c oxidase assembly factor CtaG